MNYRKKSINSGKKNVNSNAMSSASSSINGVKSGVLSRGSRTLQYEIRKRSKRNIIARINSKNKVVISIPPRVAYKVALEFIEANFDLLHEKLSSSMQKKQDVKERDYIHYLGGKMKKTQIVKIYHDIVAVDKRRKLKVETEEKMIEKVLKEKAQEMFSRKVAYWSNIVGNTPNKLRIKKMKSAWGICYGNGSITLNLRLLSHPTQIIDYVIVHELCHMTEMNHSTKFWNLVARYFPKYKEAKLYLKKAVSSN